MSTEQVTNQTYDRIAADFAERNWNRMLPSVLDSFAAAVTGTQPVLDLGCGPGRDVVLLRQRGLNVVGSDLSAGMLKEARQRGVNSALLQANMRRLPLWDASFSGVWMCASLLHVPRANVPDVLAEVHRILESNGVLFITVKRGDGDMWTHTNGWERFFTLFQPDELRGLVAQAGFTINELSTNVTELVEWISLFAVKHT